MEPNTPAGADSHDENDLLGMYYDIPPVLSALALTSSPFDLDEFDRIVDGYAGNEVDSYLHLKAKQPSIVADGWLEDDVVIGDDIEREKSIRASGEGVEGPEDANHVHEVDMGELKNLMMLFFAKPYCDTLAVQASYKVRSLLL